MVWRISVVVSTQINNATIESNISRKQRCELNPDFLGSGDNNRETLMRFFET